MKPAKGGVTTNQSCSCTSCMYRSESDSPSLRRIIAQGSKIDKLYYGKYIPLRERKLLDKLVRTRAVYDDIRNQLLPASNINVSLADMKPRKKTLTAKPDKHLQKGGNIPTLVDLVDKGNVLLPEISSESCNCCICSSELSIQDETSHMHKHRGHPGAEMTSKSSVISRYRAGEESKLGKAVHFRTKHVRSDPCTCTYKFSKIMKRHSKSVVKKLRKNRPEPVLEPLASAPEQTKPKKQKTIKQSIEKVKQSKTRLLKGLHEGVIKSATKIKETKMKVKENVEAIAKKSIEKRHETKQRIQEKIESSNKPEATIQNSEVATGEKVFKIRKDSLTKFREKLRKKRELKDWECDFDCRTEECVPEECFKIITRRRLRKIKDTSIRRQGPNAERRGTNIGEKQKVSQLNIQAEKNKKSIEPSKQKQISRKIETEKKDKLNRSCVCVEIKKKDAKSTNGMGAIPVKTTRKTKSKTNFPRKLSKDSERPITSEHAKEETKIPKQLSGVKVGHLKIPNQIEYKLKVAQMQQKSRQAVRVGSSFNFNLEFYKVKPMIKTQEMKSRQEVRSIIKERQQNLKTKGRVDSKNTHKRDNISETTLKQSMKNIQAVGHPLKRCFCTLKLKSRKTKTKVSVDKSMNKNRICPCTSHILGKTESVTESDQYKKKPKLPHVLGPYDYEPICIPGECDPIKCMKRIRKRNKRHTVSINTKKQRKLSSSMTTKPTSSASSKSQVRNVRKPKRCSQKEYVAKKSIAPLINSSSSQRQAIRIGSTFSFQIEFSTGTANDAVSVMSNKEIKSTSDFGTVHKNTKRTIREKGVPRAKRYIKHKYSQISSSTKTKFTSQKHRLRRCFCTLKFNKMEKKNVKIISTSKGIITSGQSMANIPKPKPAVKTVSLATKKMRKSKAVVEPQLLPYECEPGICIPGDCDPYECLKLLKRREVKELQSKGKTSNTDYRKTKSTSSFTPKSFIQSRTKNVQSTLVAYKGRVPSSRLTIKMPLPRRPSESPNNLNKQAVRIGSSFSFNIEFYKDKPAKDGQIIKFHQPSKSLVKQNRKQAPLKERGSQPASVAQQKSVIMQAERKQRSVIIGPALKRCFCTLKLPKPGKDATKDVISVGTKTPKFKNKQLKFETVATNKKLKRYQNNLKQLEPYECEPYVCTPGECDPYECLGRIKKRNREIGVIAKPSKMKSTSSSVQNVGIAIKDAFVQSKAVEQKVVTKKYKQEKYTPVSGQIPKIQTVHTGKQPRQSVRFGSNFSFDIEFYKDRKSDENEIVQIPRERGDVQMSKLLKSRGEQPVGISIHQHKSQVNFIKKVNRATGVPPIIKRCFCTLQLQKKKNHPIKPPNVYTVSRVVVTKPTFTHKLLSSEKKDPCSYDKSHINGIKDSEISTFNVLSCSTVQFNPKLVDPYSLNSSNYSDYAHSISGPIFSQPIFTISSNYIRKNKCVKPQKAARSLCTKNPSSTRRIKKISEINLLKYIESYTSNVKQEPNEMGTYLRRQFCAMNIQVADRYRSSANKHKLKPYECEPGVCVPYECDPLICREKIMKRLMRNAAKSSGTQRRLHSASSTTLNAAYRSKRLQSNATYAPERRIHKQSLSTSGHNTGYAGNHKQAVRVGSNFSFDIEFSKDKLQLSDNEKEDTHYPSTTRSCKKADRKMRHRGTREYPNHRMDRESQSITKMEHRGSSATPLLKRCFCTLKLHKKGRQGKDSTNGKGVAFNNGKATAQTVDSSQNTEPQKYRKVRHALEPDECEQGICVPRKCNPYECLELIKKRKLRSKDFGTNLTKFGRMSTSSMTPTQRRMKNRRNQLNFQEKRQHVQKLDHPVQSLGSATPSRQAVRIGSTFSFNVELFKEYSNLLPKPTVTSKNMSYKPDTESQNLRRTHDFKERFSQDERSMSHKDSQSDFMQHMKSTMTNSFIKRCFCTAKLHKNEKIISHSQDKTVDVNFEQQSNGTQSFLQRCLCVMKSLTAAKVKTGIPSQTEQGSVLKPFYPPASHGLEPHECTPGVCVPDECDPYVCEQLIRKRNAKLGTKVTSTRRPRTKSQSSSSQSYKTPRARHTQMNIDTSSRMVKPTSSGDLYRRKHIENHSSPGRQAVRIGSNFNIEFYKDNAKAETFKHRPLKDDSAKRRRISDDSRRYKPKTKSSGSFEREKHSHSQESQAQGIKKQDRASGVGQLLQRCFCTLNLRKPKASKRYSETGTQSLRTAVIREPPNIDTKSVMTLKKTPHKLEPNECEPNTCIPGQCDPYECEKRIKKRLRREYGTSTVQLKTKSATSMASSDRKLRNLKIQSKLRKQHRKQTDMERSRKSTYNKTDRPTRQAVRLGSTFSFDIEFVKENSKDANIRRMTDSKIRRHKNAGDFNSDNKKRSSVPCNTKTCQAKKRMREVDSQVLAKKMKSTMSGVTPFIKRCFCILKLQKPIAALGENSNNNTHPRIATDNKSTYTSKKLNKPLASMRTRPLDPYECEPGVCVPGECDPYECKKRINMRDTRRHSVSSNTERSQDSSKYVSARTGYKGRKSQAMTLPYKRKSRKVNVRDRPRPFIRQSDLKSSNSPHCQAVHIGSNLNFNIEFYKDKYSDGLPKQTYPQIDSQQPYRINKFKVNSKSKSRNTGVGNRGISFYHRKSQADGPKSETKGSGMGPLLKRCFCTLKLHKPGKQLNAPSVRLQANYAPKSSSFDASTETKKQRRVLEPYECEPNVCVPGFCDPYDCLRRIKRRQMKEFGVTTERPSISSSYSLTSKKTTRDKSLKTKHLKNRRLQKNVSFEKDPHYKANRRSTISENPNRQAVRIGSSFNFDIEFYKQNATPYDQGHGDGRVYNTPALRERKQRPRKIKSQGSQGKCSPHCQGVQVEGTQRQSRGSGMAPMLKRCFCTLALQNTPKQPAVKIKPLREAKTKDICTQSKCTFTKSKSLPFALDPYECEPYVCVPGECDPYDCYERIKRRNAYYKSRGSGTDAKRYSQGSNMTTRHGKYPKSKRTQSVVLAGHQRQHRSSSVNESVIVEQPRMQLFSDIANRNVVRVGSNISFNIEFYKEVTPATGVDSANKHRENAATIDPRDTKHTNTYKTTDYHSRESQAQTLKTQNKGSLVTNALKRCFCTAQFHKSNGSQHKKEDGKCVECRPKSIFRPQQYQVYYHKSLLKKNPMNKCLCTVCDNSMCQNTKATSTKSNRRIKLKRRSVIKSKKTKNTNEMETILPYTPNKFNKKASKTLFANCNKKGKVNGEGKLCANCKCPLCPKLKQDSIHKKHRLKTSKDAKKLFAKISKKPIPEGKDAITSTSSNLNEKSFLCRCKELFSKQKIPKDNVSNPCVDSCPLGRSDKRQKGTELTQTEKLKKTKSDRHPIKTNKKAPKKTKSLKISRYSENNFDNRSVHQNKPNYSQYQSGDMLRKPGILFDEYKRNICPHYGDNVPGLNEILTKVNKKQVKFSDSNKDKPPASSNLMPKFMCEVGSEGKLLAVLPLQEKTIKHMESRSKTANKKNKNKSNKEPCLFCHSTQFKGIATDKTKSNIKDQPLEEEDSPCDQGIYKKKTISIGDKSRVMQSGATLKIAAKGSKKQSTVPGGKLDIDQIIDTLTKNIEAIKKAKSRVLKTLVTKEEICSCYSSICECAQDIRKEKERAQKIEMELQEEKRMLEEKERRRKEAEKEAKKKHKETASRRKRYDREDATRRQKRSKENKYLGHRLKNVKTSDVLLAADSILDIAKLGCTVVGDVARSTCRLITDPGYTCKKIKHAAKDPGSILRNVVNDSGVIATLKRVLMRVTAMKGIQAVRNTLEENQFTGYLMKMAEEDPRKRMKVKKKDTAKKQEPALDDFECSLYMASLRKKRFISVYYLCPWFYPHFLTLIDVIGQVTDLILFLVAVFVWSPCILCMELCRVFVCCFLCTG